MKNTPHLTRSPGTQTGQPFPPTSTPPFAAPTGEGTDAPAAPAPPRPKSGTTKADTSPPIRPPSRRRTKQAAATGAASGVPEVILVGCGSLAQESFVPALFALQQAGALQVGSLIDPSEASREDARRLFPSATPLPSLEAVIAPPDALVILATPVRFHATQASAALKRGWHVFCASPFAPTVREGALMIAAAQRHERLLAVDLSRRFFPAAHYLRTLCRDHLLGPPVSFRIHDGTTRPVPPNPAASSDKLETPDGALHDLGVPALDLLTWCLGSATVKNYADDAMGGVEANAFIELTFPEGVHGTVHLSRDWTTDQSCTFVFERGIVRWDTTRPAHLTFQLGSAPSALQGELVTRLSPTHPLAGTPLLRTIPEAAAAQVEHLLRAITRHESLRISATEAMHSLPIIEECYARRTPLPQPWLPRAEAVQARAYAPPVTIRRS